MTGFLTSWSTDPLIGSHIYRQLKHSMPLRCLGHQGIKPLYKCTLFQSSMFTHPWIKNIHSSGRINEWINCLKWPQLPAVKPIYGEFFWIWRIIQDIQSQITLLKTLVFNPGLWQVKCQGLLVSAMPLLGRGYLEIFYLSHLFLYYQLTLFSSLSHCNRT